MTAETEPSVLCQSCGDPVTESWRNFKWYRLSLDNRERLGQYRRNHCLECAIHQAINIEPCTKEREA
jgi:hypothetical protein